MRNLNLDEIKCEDLPLMVFSDCTTGFVEWLIKWKSRGLYNHVQWTVHPGKFASQGGVYKEVPYSRYAKHGGRLKFVEVLGLTAVHKRLIKASIEKKLKLPWYKRTYDFLGIAGQAIGIKWLNIPWLEYCSEDMPQHLKYLARHLPDGLLKSILKLIPAHASPAELNRYFKRYPECFKVYGRWDSDSA